MIKLKNKFNCCGCELCAEVCTKQAIKMTEDDRGFLYPKVDNKLCNNCGRCEQVCPMLHVKEARRPEHTYAVKNKDLSIRMVSSSGGVFSIFCKQIINNGGVVYGAVFDTKWNVRHARIEKIEDIHLLRGSKYVQSRMSGIYASVKADLKSGIPVLFSGCHCHIAALHSYLKCSYDNLLTVDVICGGVPSPRIWKEYLAEEIAAHRAANGGSTVSLSLNYTPLIKGVRFRDKSNGWRKFCFDLQLAEASADGKRSSVSTSYKTYIWKHVFMLSWLRGFISRPSCHKCRFRRGKSGANYTIADFWCIECSHPEFSDDKGISMLLSYKEKIPSYIANDADFIETSFQDAAQGQECVLNSHPYNPVSKIYFFLHDKCKMALTKTLHYCLIIDDLRLHCIKIIRAFKRPLYKIYLRLCQK